MSRLSNENLDDVYHDGARKNGSAFNHYCGLRAIAEAAVKAEREGQEAVGLMQHKKPLVNSHGDVIGYSDWVNGRGLAWWPTRRLYTTPPAAPLPEGWVIERVEGDSVAMKLQRVDGRWSAFMRENGPRDSLTFDFLEAMLAASQPEEK